MFRKNVDVKYRLQQALKFAKNTCPYSSNKFHDVKKPALLPYLYTQLHFLMYKQFFR